MIPISKEFKQRVYQTIEIGNKNDLISRMFDIFLTVVIILNILVTFLQTFESLSAFKNLFNAVEEVTLAVFLVEYLLRLWTSDIRYPDKTRLGAMIAFITSFDGIIELLTILPFFFLSGFVALRMLRIVRIFHLFRINKTVDSFHVISNVIYEKRTQLASSFFIIFVLMISSSLCMYSAEHAAQPEAFRNALSGIWWSMSAVLTVGYGDIYPITTVGKIIGIIISFLGVCVVAIPTGIISAGFVEQARRAEIDPSAMESHLNTVTIDIDSLWINKTVREVEQLTGLKLLVIKRGDAIMNPSPSVTVQMKDQILTLEETDFIPNEEENTG